jgi:DnaJ-class molecular chaperone
MTSPYQLLGIDERANDAEIKLAYLQQVKDNPPDRDPQRFRQIQQAYETVKDSQSRMKYALFHLPEIDFENLLDQAFGQPTEFQALSADDFCKLLNAVPVEKALANALAHKSS